MRWRLQAVEFRVAADHGEQVAEQKSRAAGTAVASHRRLMKACDLVDIKALARLVQGAHERAELPRAVAMDFEKQALELGCGHQELAGALVRGFQRVELRLCSQRRARYPSGDIAAAAVAGKAPVIEWTIAPAPKVST